MVFKIEIERDMCISCGNCVDECDALFEIANDDFATLIDGEIDEDNNAFKEYDDIKCGLDAAGICPAACIAIFEDGNEIS